ncbi:MAG: hypothetical protein MJ092_00435 [Lachnospiraceae bacterium]|nr:hypothetical protein [Lachnospiraceae bacterium]
MKERRPALIIALLLCLGITACGKSVPEPASSSQVTPPISNRVVAVQAGDFYYYADQVQRDLDMLLDNYELAGVILSEEDRAAAAQETLNGYATRVLVKAQLQKLGLNKIDNNTLYALRNEAQKSYDAYWQKFRNSDSSAGYSDEELTSYLEENGINIDYFFEELKTNYELQQIMDYYKVEVNVTDEDIDHFYKENYVQPCRERYEKNIPLFEEEVICGDYDSAYVPDGFRILYQIVIPVPEDIRNELTRIETEATTQAKDAEEAYNKIASYVIDGKDTASLEETYRNAMNRIDELNVEYGRLWQSVLKSTSDECDQLYARLKDGESFEDLMQDYNPDNALIYHAKSQRWSEELMAGAASLNKKGDYSQPTLCSDGVHILYYYDDIPGGETKLENEEDRSYLRELLLQQRSLEELEELTHPWAEEFGLITDISTLKY